MAKQSNYDVVATSLMIALQDLDCPDMTAEELERAVTVATAKATVVTSMARYQKTLVDAEKLRLEYGQSQSADAMIGEDRKPEPLKLEASDEKKAGKDW